MKIVYLCPATNTPSGGIRRLFRHVEILCDATYNAFIGLPEGASEIDWFDHDVPILHFSKMKGVDSGDVLVVPDAYLDVIRPTVNMDIRRVAICLGYISPFHRSMPGEDWGAFKIDAVMANSEGVANFLKESGFWPEETPIHILENSIDTSKYYCDPDQKKAFQVAYINKAGDRLFPMLERAMLLAGEPYIYLKFVELSGMSQDEYAATLRKSVLFGCNMYNEGFSKPILEAMACGCACFGSHGVGGEDFVVPVEWGNCDPNFYEVGYGNIRQFCTALRLLAFRSFEKKPYFDIVKMGIKTAARYTEEGEKKSILDFWKGFLG